MNSSSNRGFASMDEGKQREIASKGGKASHGAHRSSTSRTNRNENESSGSRNKSNNQGRGR